MSWKQIRWRSRPDTFPTFGFPLPGVFIVFTPFVFFCYVFLFPLLVEIAVVALVLLCKLFF